MALSSVVASLSLAAACGGGDDPPTPDAAPLAGIDDRCLPEPIQGVSVADHGDSVVVVAHLQQITYGYKVTRVLKCIVTETGGPSSLVDRVWQTSAIDGQLDEEWDGYEANWSYAPGSGLHFAVDAK